MKQALLVETSAFTEVNDGMQLPEAFAITVATGRGRRFYVRRSRGGVQTAWSLAGGALWSRNVGEFESVFDRLEAEGRKPLEIRLYRGDLA